MNDSAKLFGECMIGWMMRYVGVRLSVPLFGFIFALVLKHRGEAQAMRVLVHVTHALYPLSVMLYVFGCGYLGARAFPKSKKAGALLGFAMGNIIEISFGTAGIV